MRLHTDAAPVNQSLGGNRQGERLLHGAVMGYGWTMARGIWTVARAVEFAEWPVTGQQREQANVTSGEWEKSLTDEGRKLVTDRTDRLEGSAPAHRAPPGAVGGLPAAQGVRP